MQYGTLFVAMICFLMTACQHHHGPTIGYDQLMMYATQNENLSLLNSKARLQSLGGVIPPPSSARPLFGHKFADAKNKVRILDIRNAEEFQRKNLAMDSKILTPVVQIPTANLLMTENFESLLATYNIYKDSIILIVASDLERAQSVFARLTKEGYIQTLYYENVYP
ncbi:MAG: hypothetical protein HUU57_13285 [Bdellovibrio sp.]|nr:hypothetical protein [Bdellovibrio sp.]